MCEGGRHPAGPLPAAPKAAAAPAGLAHKHLGEKLPLVLMSREKRTGSGSSGFLSAIFNVLKFAVMLMFFFSPFSPLFIPVASVSV